MVKACRKACNLKSFFFFSFVIQNVTYLRPALALTSDIPLSQTTVSFIGGGVAGAGATLASYPFDLLRTVLAAQGEPKVGVS